MTVEGAPHLRAEHLPVFDCANRCGKKGKRFLAPMGHVRMMAAAQPFLSRRDQQDRQPARTRPRSKTIAGHLHARAGSSASRPSRSTATAASSSQPLNTADGKTETEEKAEAKAAAPAVEAAARRVRRRCRAPVREGARPPPTRRVIACRKKRRGFTQEARVGGHKVFLRTGEYEDGSLGEIFIDMHKEGAAFRSLMNCFAISVSMGLQHGVPLESFVDQFTFTRFEPGGIVEGHPNIKIATSIIDYVFRVLGVEYLKRYDLAQVPPKEMQIELRQPDRRRRGQARVEEHSAGRDAGDRGDRAGRRFGFDDEHAAAAGGGNALDQQLGEMMGDAPMCDKCGHITVRNGACYKCLNCGNSMGCS